MTCVATSWKLSTTLSPFPFRIILGSSARDCEHIPHPSTAGCLLLLFCVMFDCMVWTVSYRYIRSLCLHTWPREYNNNVYMYSCVQNDFFYWCGTTRALKNFHTRAAFKCTNFCTCTRLVLSTIVNKCNHLPVPLLSLC